MPSFLNKVFGYKRHDDKEAARPVREPSDSTLLDGKYEAIPPILSPSASSFAEAQQTRESDRDGTFSLLKSKIRGGSQKSKHSENIPHLTLRLPGPKDKLDSRALGVVFEADPDSQILLDDAVIAEKRLNPLEALILIRACTKALTEHGLETLGIMHPHWFTASPDVQRKLISLFIPSLTRSRTTTLASTPTSSTSAFEKELHYTRSPHDVAAVLRWGLRHLSLENNQFGKPGVEWGWYNTFSQAERSASYPHKGFSELLLPQLPAPHLELLTATLSLISSLASRAEANGISGSKLSKFLGLWLLVATRTEQSDDWNRFYARWERCGRILEHLFLAYLRDESLGQRLPTRLQELVKHYPYNKGSPTTGDDLLPRPRFSTRQYDALFVRVETLLMHDAEQPKQHPIRLLLEAFQLPLDNASNDEHTTLWNTLKTTVFEEAAPSDSEGPQFTRIFVDETIHLLSLIPADNSFSTSPIFLTTPIAKAVSHKRSSSLTKAIERATGKSNADTESMPASPTSPSSMITDWAQFTLSGFGDAPATQPLPALLSQDDDVEITRPQVSRKSSRHRGKSRSRRRPSEDHGPLDTPASSHPSPESFIIETKITSVHAVQIDEAFVDFWSDAIVDPISADWPTFVICGLKQIPSAQQSFRWLVIEQAYSRQESFRAPSPDGRRGRSPRPSFRSDISGFRINSVFSSARKRFSVFSKSATDLDLKRSGGKTPVTGELGEILLEEEPAYLSPPPIKTGSHTDGNAAAKATVTSGTTVDVADQPSGAEISIVPTIDIPSVPVSKELAGTVQAIAGPPSIELPCPSVRVSEETITIERFSPPVRDAVNAKVDGSLNQATNIVPLSADTSGSPSTQDISDRASLASGPDLAGNRTVEEGQARAIPVKIENEVRPVEFVASDRDEHIHAESTRESLDVDVGDNSSQKDPETVVVVAATPVAQPPAITATGNQSPEPGSHLATQPPHGASADAGQHLSPVSATEVITTEAGAQLEPRSLSSVSDEREEAKELAEHVEIPTPTPELLAFVEETPGQDVSVDVSRRNWVAQVPAAKPNTLADTAPQLVAFNDLASQPQLVAAELQATLKAEDIHLAEKPSDEVILAVHVDVHAVHVEIEHAADEAPEPVVGEVQRHVQDMIVPTAEGPLVDTKLEANVFTANMSVSRVPDEAEAQAVPDDFVQDTTGGTQDTEMSPPVPTALVDETCRSEITDDAHKAVNTFPVLETEVKTQDPAVDVVTPPIPLAEEAKLSSGAELPPQVCDPQVVEPLSTGSSLEVATAALATSDEVVVKVEVQDGPSDDTEGLASGSVQAEDAPEVAIDANEPTPNTVIEPELVEDESAAPTAEAAQVSVEVAAPIASESVAITPSPIVTIKAPVAYDEQAPTELGPSSGEPAPQFVDEAVTSSSVVDSTPKIIAGEVEVHGALQPAVDIVDELGAGDAEPAPDAPILAEPELVDVSVAEDDPAPVKTVPCPVVIESQPAPTVPISETSRISEPQHGVDIVEQPACKC